MKWARVIVLLLSSLSTGVCLAQNNSPGSDPVQRAFTQAMRDGRLADAENLLTEAIRDLDQSDPRNPRLAQYLKLMAGLADRKGRQADAIDLCNRAYEIDRNAYGPSDLRLTNDLINLSNYARVAGDTQAAERYLDQALEIVRANTINMKSVSDVDFAAAVYGSLASFYIDKQRWTDAEPLMRQEKKLCDLFEEPYRQGYALCGSLNDRLAKVYSAEGRAVDAESVPHNKDYPPELDALNATAAKFQKDGLYPSAEDTYTRAIALAEKMEPDPQNHYGGLVVTEMHLLGQLYEAEGMKDKAEKTYLSAFEFNESKSDPGTSHSAYARMLDPFDLVKLYRSEGRWKDAEAIFQRVLNARETALGERNREYVESLMAFAALYVEEGKKDATKYALALPLYERALAIQQLNLGPNDRDLLALMGEYADVLSKLHDDDKAAEVKARMSAISSAQEQ